MNHDKINEALSHISDDKLAEAAHAPRRRLRWAGAVAALLVLAITAGVLLPRLSTPAQAGNQDPSSGSHLSSPSEAESDLDSFLSNPLTVKALLATPQYPKMSPYPNEAKYAESGDWDAFDLEYSAWRDSINAQRDQPDGYTDSLSEYFSASIPVFLSDSGNSNAVCSPLSVYMALAMLAEVTGSNSRQQILDLLAASSIETLRNQAGQVWNAHYMADNASATVLANSLWLDDDLNYNADTVQTLASSYYASVFQGDLGTGSMNTLLRDWLNAQTGNLLQEQAESLEMSSETILALVSTVYYRAKWSTEFNESGNITAPFHTPSGDVDATFMYKVLNYGPYYWGEDYGAAYLSLDDGSKMWLILPDEGYTPSDILESGEALSVILGDYVNCENKAFIRVNLRLPKFDVSGEPDLKAALQTLGITDIFQEDTADFSPILSDINGSCWLDTASHAARVKIDEEGVEAAAYTAMLACGSAMPPDDEVDFTLDRPFLFVITSHDDLPLFAGIVSDP